jgi:hypothetical protein
MVIARTACSVGGLHHEESREYQLQIRSFWRSGRLKSAASDDKALQARRGASRGKLPIKKNPAKSEKIFVLNLRRMPLHRLIPSASNDRQSLLLSDLNCPSLGEVQADLDWDQKAMRSLIQAVCVVTRLDIPAEEPEEAAA